MSRSSIRASYRLAIAATLCTWTLAPNVPARAADAAAKPAPLIVYTDPAHVDADFPFQGEYVGQVVGPDGAKTRLGAQVRALGDGLFRTMFFVGGLPGDGWDGKTIIQKAPSTDDTTPGDAKLAGGKVVVDQIYKATVDGRTLDGRTDRGIKFRLTRIDRKSPTLGAKPPAGALVLFDGTSADAWRDGHMTPDKLLATGAISKRKYKDFSLHVEFMISYVPRTKAIWTRPNSGVYLQERYEIQILDSFGIVMRVHDCGVLYGQITPTVNMCYPPLAWQTYDMDFKSARYDPSGKKTKLARCTVKFNGVTTLDDVEILHSTPGGVTESPEDRGFYLQAHGLPVFFRNIWTVER